MSRPFAPFIVVAVLAVGCAAVPPTPLLHDQYRVTATGQRDVLDEPADRAAAALAPASAGHTGDVFAGTDRRNSKTSVANAGLESYSTIGALRSALPTDQQMLSLGISKAPDSPRVPEEQHNVTVGGFIYAISKESDNDFHVIVGDQGCHRGGCFINVEVSGLPQQAGDPNRPTLTAVRSKFLGFFGGAEPGTSGGYDQFNPPIPVMLTGSLFFDVDHKAGVVGPTGFKPNSAWEIHPLTDITFER
jgi:hypothetical protein